MFATLVGTSGCHPEGTWWRHEGWPSSREGQHAISTTNPNQEDIVDSLLERHEKSPTVHLFPEDDEGG